MDSSGIVHAKYVSDPDDFEVDEFEMEEEEEQEQRKRSIQRRYEPNDDNDNTPLSPDTNEFLALEKQVLMEEEKDHFRLEQTPSRNSSAANRKSSTSVDLQGPSIIVRTASYTEKSPSSMEQEHLLQLEQQKQLLQSELESKLEERKRSIDAAENLVMDEEGQLQMLERRPLRYYCPMISVLI